MYRTHTDVILAAIQEMASRARASTPQTLERKRSRGYASRIGATGTYSSDDDVIIVNETGSVRKPFVSQDISSLTLSRRTPVAVKHKHKTHKTYTLSPASAAPLPAKVSPPIKSPVVPVIDARLRISSSKVQPILYAAHQVTPDIVSSLWGLLGVGTIRP